MFIVAVTEESCSSWLGFKNERESYTMILLMPKVSSLGVCQYDIDLYDQQIKLLHHVRGAY